MADSAERSPPSPRAESPKDRTRLVDDLRRTIRRLEDGGTHMARVHSTGSPVLDATLPWNGLPTACLHEVLTARPGPLSLEGGAATGFAASLAGRLAGPAGTVLWCRRGIAPHGPGLPRYGLDPARLVMVEARDDQDILWAMEEGLRGGGPAVVLGELDGLSLTAGRRLQLAAERSGATGLLLRPQPADANRLSPGTAMTRWRVGSMSSPPQGPPAVHWRLELLHCRHRITGDHDQWRLEWNDETGGFRVAADLRHRPAAPRLAAGGARIIPLRRTG